MKNSRNNNPDISIIIASCGRVRSLELALAGFEHYLTQDFSWEVLIMFNSCKGATVAEFETLEVVTRLPVRVFNIKEGGKCTALNEAVAKSQGHLLVFTDDDVIHRSGWLTELWEAHLRWGDAYILGGRIVPSFPSGTPEWVKNPKFVPQSQAFSEYDFGNEEAPILQAPFGPNMAIPRDLMEGQTFDERLGPGGKLGIPMGDETILGEKLRVAGATFVYVPTAVVEHIIRSEQVSTQWLLSRARQYGKASAIRHGGIGSGDIASEEVFAQRTKKLRRKVAKVYVKLILSLGFSKKNRFRLRWRREFKSGFMEGVTLFREFRGKLN